MDDVSIFLPAVFSTSWVYICTSTCMHKNVFFFSRTQSISLYRIGFFPLKRKSPYYYLFKWFKFPECSYHILALYLRIQYTNSDNILCRVHILHTITPPPSPHFFSINVHLKFVWFFSLHNNPFEMPKIMKSQI